MKIRETHKQTVDIYFSVVRTLNIKTQNLLNLCLMSQGRKQVFLLREGHLINYENRYGLEDCRTSA